MLSQSDFEFAAQALPFFSALTEDEKQEIYYHGVHRSYEKGQILSNSQDHCLGLILIIQGVLRSYLLSPSGKEVTLYRLWGGDTCILSASCLLKNIDFDLFLDAQEDTELIVIDSGTYAHLMEQNPVVQSYTYQLTNNRFSDVMWMLEQIFFMSLDQRIAVFLLDECSKNQTDVLHLTQSEIALYIGSAREAVTRMLKYMQEEHLIELFRGGIRILDRKKLYQIIQP